MNTCLATCVLGNIPVLNADVAVWGSTWAVVRVRCDVTCRVLAQLSYPLTVKIQLTDCISILYAFDPPVIIHLYAPVLLQLNPTVLEISCYRCYTDSENDKIGF